LNIEKVDFVGTVALLNPRNTWTKVYTIFFAQRGRNRCRAPGFQILDTSIRFGDIRRILDVFAFINFKGAVPPPKKVVPGLTLS